MATIYDVANAAKVSIASVSLVMNNPDTPRVGAVKRKQILALAGKLGYSPSGLARALSSGSTRILGLVVPMRDPIFFNNFIAEVLAGIQSCVMERGYHLMIYSHSAKSGRITKGELTQSRFVDGVIVFNTRMCSLQDMKDTIDDLKGANIPFVMTNCYAGKDQINYVGVDDYEIGSNGAAYLAGRGHAQIALISGAARSPMTPQVLSGFKAGLRKAGLKFEPRLHFCSDYDAKTIHDNIVAWFSGGNPPTAIFCADDQLVPDVYRTLEELDKRIPENVSVLGRGNLPIGTVLKPHLTTIAIPAFEMGKKAAELLIDAVAANPKTPRRISLKAQLIERESA
ncbi:MAG TPA: LacI family DNA-binding transcriptional regulator [Terracidiphilus sp.]|nr:LacI family DNA-binding transcriptional regulator [Terracidiphilus sp.]